MYSPVVRKKYPLPLTSFFFLVSVPSMIFVLLLFLQLWLLKVYKVYDTLSKISPMFSIAAAFGNVHGVYKAGNVVLSPHLLGNHQKFIKEKINSSLDKPAFLVMHGGSGSSEVISFFSCPTTKIGFSTRSLLYVYSSSIKDWNCK